MFCPLTSGYALNFFSGATTSSVRVTSVKDTGGGNVDSKASHSHSVGITNENGGSIDVSFVIAF